jgi:hypothetical protein
MKCTTPLGSSVFYITFIGYKYVTPLESSNCHCSLAIIYYQLAIVNYQLSRRFLMICCLQDDHRLRF